MVYRERRSRLDGAVVWENTVDDAPLRVMPDGCMDLMLVDGGLVVAGPDTRAQLIDGPPGQRYVGLRFAPGVAPVALGVPAHELRDQRVPLDALWPGTTVRSLAEQVAEASDRGSALEAVAADRLGELGPPDPVLAEVADRLRRGHPVSSVAESVALSERQLHRRCLAAFGYGPKTLARILRMRRALDLARRATPFAAVAAVAGYADQAHLAREVRALTGRSLGALTR